MKNITARSYPTLKHWRDANELSQQQAAKTLGISQSTYTLLERKKRFVKGERAKTIMEITHVPLEVLAGAE